jgi:hypothetical protein
MKKRVLIKWTHYVCNYYMTFCFLFSLYNDADPTMNSPQKINTVSPQQSKKPDVFFCRDNKPIDAGTVKETSEATKKELPTSINKQSTQDASSGVLRSSSKVVWRPRLSVDPKTSLSRQVKVYWFI